MGLAVASPSANPGSGGCSRGTPTEPASCVRVWLRSVCTTAQSVTLRNPHRPWLNEATRSVAGDCGDFLKGPPLRSQGMILFKDFPLRDKGREPIILKRPDRLLDDNDSAF